MDIHFQKHLDPWITFSVSLDFTEHPIEKTENTNIEKFLQETRGYLLECLLYLKHESLGPKAGLLGRKGKMVQ